MSNKQTVFIDGSIGEGGGQILRTSLALSCITARPLHIENIRAARRNPGLAKQHISCVKAACQISDGRCDGDIKGSKVLDFQPGPIHGGDFNLDIGSAGSASLVIQTILPALFLANDPSQITITGGTHNPLAPPYDFLSETFLPAVTAAGFQAGCKLIRYGFFPAGGGAITFKVKPSDRNSNRTIDLCQPAEKFQASARIYTANLPSHIAERQRTLLLQTQLAQPETKLKRLTNPLTNQNIKHTDVTDCDGAGNCVMIYLTATAATTVFTAFGQRGKPSKNVISELENLTVDFLKTGAAINHFLADQLLVYMALSAGGSILTDKLSLHLQTNIEIIKQFLPVDFKVQQQNKAFRISCYPTKN